MKDRTYTPEEIQKKFDALPADIKAMIYSADMSKVVQAIGAKHQLHIDQLEVLESEAADVMSGFTKPEDFPRLLTQSLRLDQLKAEAVAKDVSDQLFMKIRESLKQLYATGGPAPTPPTAATKPMGAPTVSTPIPLAQKLPVMTAPPTPPTPAAPIAPTVKPSVPTPPPTPPVAKPQVPLAPHPHDLTLLEKTITTPAAPKPTTDAGQNPASAASTPAKPANYPSDPYREPVEP